MLKRLILAPILLVVVIYVCDGLAVYFRHSYGTVVVKRYYAIPLKGKKTEYMGLEPETDTCVNSLFPHSGYPPCWYLAKHNRRRIEM